MEELQAHYNQLLERKKNIQLINDQVGGWCGRVGTKLAEQCDDYTLLNKDARMVQQFKNIGTLCH